MAKKKPDKWEWMLLERERLPSRGKVHWRKQYFEVGDQVIYRSGESLRPRSARVTQITVNRFGRVNYYVRPRGKPPELALLEELVADPSRVVR